MIAYTFWRDDMPAWYASELPGQGGVDWGYTADRSKALPLSDYYWRRFAADMRACGRVGFAVPQYRGGQKAD